MQIGIVGLPFSGKSTLFQTITRTHLDPSVLSKAETHHAIIKVPDERLDKCSAIFSPKNTVNATIEFVDVVGLKKCVADFTHETGWTPGRIHHVAGAFRYTPYDFLNRWAMKYIAYRKGAPTDTSRDYELTDWDDLTRFVNSLAKSPANPRLPDS